MVKVIRQQVKHLLQEKTVLFVYSVLLVFVLANFFDNVKTFHEIKYVTQMYDLTKMQTLSSWSSVSYFLMEYFPFLVAIPTAFSYLNDKKSKVKLYIHSRAGERNYWYGKLIAVFVVTFLVFTIPFLIELGMSCLCFDLRSMGDPSGFQIHQTIMNDNKYLFGDLYIRNRMLYVVVRILMIGVVAGVLAVWNVSLTVLPFFKFKIFALAPIYLLFFILQFVGNSLRLPYTVSYFSILRAFEIEEFNVGIYILFLLFLILVSIVLIEWKIKKEDLL